MKKRFSSVLIALVLILSFAACGGKSENRKIIEAAAIHTTFMDRYDSLYHILHDEKVRISENLSAVDQSDPRRSAYESMLRSIDRSIGLLEGWEEAVVGVPGLERPHHHHGEGHKHNQDNDALMKSLSDQEILDLQKAYATRLDDVIKEINTLLGAIKIYDTQMN
jgi:hypothetical protein